MSKIKRNKNCRNNYHDKSCQKTGDPVHRSHRLKNPFLSFAGLFMPVQELSVKNAGIDLMKRPG
jgi:hypothetical protein